MAGFSDQSHLGRWFRRLVRDDLAVWQKLNVTDQDGHLGVEHRTLPAGVILRPEPSRPLVPPRLRPHPRRLPARAHGRSRRRSRARLALRSITHQRGLRRRHPLAQQGTGPDEAQLDQAGMGRGAEAYGLTPAAYRRGRTDVPDGGAALD
jgi:hypothetical protein